MLRNNIFVIASISEVVPMADPPKADNLRVIKTSQCYFLHFIARMGIRDCPPQADLPKA